MSTRDLVFRTWNETHSGHEQTFILIRVRTGEPVREVLAKASAGRYCEHPEGDASWVLRCERMLAAGHESFYEWDGGGGVSLKIRWQHFEDRFCKPNFEELGSTIAEVEKSMSLLRDLAGRVEDRRQRARIRDKRGEWRDPLGDTQMTDPRELLAVLRARRSAVEVETFFYGERPWDCTLVPRCHVSLPAAIAAAENSVTT